MSNQRYFSAFLIFLDLFLYSTNGLAQSQQWQPPNCLYGLEPGEGPMRCADPHNPKSHINQPKMNLFAFVPLQAGSDVDGICWAYRPQLYYGGHIKDESVLNYQHANGSNAFVATWSYDLDLSSRTLTLTDIRHWVSSTDHAVLDYSAASAVHIVIPLYERPQPDWPCSKEQWAALLQISTPPPSGTATGGTVTVPTIILNPDPCSPNKVLPLTPEERKKWYCP